MIDKGHVLMLARYNAWQNDQLMAVVKKMDDAVLYQDQGAFFSSVMGTLNHILWADRLWMSRWCDDVSPPSGGVPADWAKVTKTPAAWAKERFSLDGRIRIWAETLSNMDLVGDVRWRSNLMKRDFVQPISLCVSHMFNHQTHHRGQVHAMLTACGQEAPVTDLVFMPENR